MSRLTGRLARSWAPRAGTWPPCCSGALLRAHVHFSTSLTHGEQARAISASSPEGKRAWGGTRLFDGPVPPTMCWAHVGPGTTFQTASRSNLPTGQSGALTAEVMLGASRLVSGTNKVLQFSFSVELWTLRVCGH